MKLNSDTVIHGEHVVLVPYAEEFVSLHHEWMQNPRNRLAETDPAPTLEQQQKQWKRLYNSETHCVFLVGRRDDMVRGRPARDSLIGEVQLVFGQGKRHWALLELLIHDSSVRRKRYVSETLLLILLFGCRALGVTNFIVTLEQSTNRLVFASRNDAEVGRRASAPEINGGGSNNTTNGDGGGDTFIPPSSSSSSVTTTTTTSGAVTSGAGGGGGGNGNGDGSASPVVPPARRKSSLSRLRKSIKRVFRRQKTDYLERLTRHLRREDEGEHWPQALDFVLVDENRLELELDAESRAVLEATVARWGRFIKFGSMKQGAAVAGSGGGPVLYTNANARVLGRNICLVPYTAQTLVSQCHALMQEEPVYTAFGVLPPSLADEAEAQLHMSRDPDCHAFVVCAQERPGAADCVATVTGRVQLFYHGGLARLHMGVGGFDLEERTALAKETLCLCVWLAATLLPVHTIVVPAIASVRAGDKDDKAVRTICNSFHPGGELGGGADGATGGITRTSDESGGDRPDLELDLNNKDVKAALKVIGVYARMRVHVPDEMSFVAAGNV